jgi:Prealbumin-like fold domain
VERGEAMSSTLRGPRARTIRLAWAAALALIAVLVAAPSALAWHGTLVVTNTTTGGDASDTFAYTATGAGQPLTGGSFSLGNGQQKTFSNQASGGESGAGSWKPFVVTQTDDPRYDTTVACTISPVWDGTGKDGSIWSPVYSAAGGTHSASVELRWWNNVAYTTTCAFTNTRRQQATLRVVKHVVGGSAAARFDLTVDGVVALANAGDGDGTTATQVQPGAHTVGEQGGAVSDYVGTVACFDAAGTLIPTTGAPDTRQWGLTVPDGAAVTCTITNSAKAQITIAKVTDPPSDAPDRPAFSFTGDLDTFALASGESKTVLVPAGGYDVTEATRDGFVLTAIACSDSGDASGASVTDVGRHIAYISAQPGEQLTCTFTNTQMAVDPPPTATSRPRGVAAATMTPRVSVRGAELRGTTGCAATTAVAEVRGHKVKRVMFYVDGKAVRYLHRRADGRYVLRHPVAKMSAGTHHLRARVRFTRSSRLQPVSLQMTFTRCG